jgi:uncharacterized protein (DUF486 family)
VFLGRWRASPADPSVRRSLRPQTSKTLRDLPTLSISVVFSTFHLKEPMSTTYVSCFTPLGARAALAL